MILIIYNLTIVINFNSCMFIIMIIIIDLYTEVSFLQTHTHTHCFVIHLLNLLFILHYLSTRGYADI